LGLSLLCYKVMACILLNHQVWLNCSKFRDATVDLLSHLGTTNFISVSVMNCCTMSHMNFNIFPGWFSHHCVCSFYQCLHGMQLPMCHHGCTHTSGILIRSIPAALHLIAKAGVNSKTRQLDHIKYPKKNIILL
jgi:hypothetical protein